MFKRKKTGKIKSKVVQYNGITFKSTLEKNVYVELVNNGFTPQYEPQSFVIWKGFSPTVNFYDKRTKKKGEKKGTHLELMNKKQKVKDITYTPDFMFEHKGYTVIVESKGFANERFGMIKKLFRKYLENNPNYIYFMVYNVENAKEMIKILKNEY